MLPRKKRIAILISSITLIILIIIGILGFLYLKTDTFKSNETLFTKYFVQNFNILEMLENGDTLGIKNTLETNKYTSQLTGKIDYTENIGTSDENKNSPINDVKIKIDSNVDKQSQYDYKNISIGTNNDDLLKLEYLNQNETYAIRLNRIKQFVSTQNYSDENIQNIENIFYGIDISSILNLTKEEKQTLSNTYIEILQYNVSKDKYYKQPNSLITVNNQDIQANAYYIKLTVEEYNNLKIKFLEQIEKDEIILSKMELIENQIKEVYSDYQPEESLKNTFINNINEIIQEIQNNNIGNEEVKITVYESDGITIRTSIETVTNKLLLDFYDNTSIKIQNTNISEITEETIIKLEKNENESQSNILITFEQIRDNEVSNNIEFSYQEILQNNEIAKDTKLEISNNKYKAILNLQNNIKIVEQFEDKITLETDNIKLDELQEEQVDTINSILEENIQTQLSNLNSVVNLQEYIVMLQNLKIVNRNYVEIPEEVGVTDIERKRFNSQFEFFVSENLTTDNIKELMEVVENSFENMKVLLKTGEIEDLNLDLLTSETQDDLDYENNIEEILIFIKQNSKNEDKQNDVFEFLDNNKNNKFTVSLEYDDNQLVSLIRIKIQKD